MNKKQSGQALIEYLLLFSFMALLAVGMVKGIGSYLGSSVGSMAYHLTQQLTIGACEGQCLHKAFGNRNF
ncbi:hypothetical protein HBN50_15715 [Halobacteriovorax sp. GB3]|uniref:hypothetical protein n=1 Tax=Halobacteriovorax sp. GB3 TaxID=2719615 RepID=UPI00235E4CA2|nr:hypothetical protein [Halobacteriovorax sp. GB3]MDD0854559.1 hypothetical protein [Halobacteriovorax sp. GB3]